MGGAFFTMIDLRKGEPYLRAKAAKLRLSHGLVWINTFRKPQLRNQILDWIRDDQLTQKGIDKNNEVIGFYSLTTSFIDSTKTFNTHYTLDDTGQFYRSMFIRVLLDAIIIDADTLKMEDKEWWRNEILGLTDDNLQKLIEIYKTTLISYARKLLVRSF